MAKKLLKKVKANKAKVKKISIDFNSNYLKLRALFDDIDRQRDIGVYEFLHSLIEIIRLCDLIKEHLNQKIEESNE